MTVVAKVLVSLVLGGMAWAWIDVARHAWRRWRQCRYRWQPVQDPTHHPDCARAAARPAPQQPATWVFPPAWPMQRVRPPRDEDLPN